MKQEALREATTWRLGPGGDLEPDVDPWILNDMMLVQTVVEWDLRDGQGQPLPITLESLRGLEPPELVEDMIAEAQRINGVSGVERKKS
jgi:hypothetical protein